MKAQKITDITTCQQLSAVSRLRGSWAACAIAVVCVSFSSVLGALFGRVDIFSGEGGQFWILVGGAVYDADGVWSAFFLLARIISDVGPFASGIFGTHMWRFQEGARWRFSTSGWCLPHF